MDKFVLFLPILIMIESFFACIPLVINKQYGSALYWFAAGLLNLSVIFLIKRLG